MSKNVAVFVDVANIFYAAKAAGVDIDYVTLLKATTAGRDFVRAYAYTGLDPENENQRNFHAFLARHAYKVVSKDIRKYGDGKVKANLDIELVVDMMKTARNLDIAVVVSGDGDFAPAIRAVQEMGVRVEVVSFRGNTSSDLIDVADLFTDITQIAKVEKGSSRSGRRVAGDEEDLSMTEVPEKQTEGTGRRRGRGTRGGRAPEPTPVAARDEGGRNGRSRQARPVVLPGERLSKLAPAEAGAAGPVGQVAEGQEPDEAEELEVAGLAESGAVPGAEGEGEEGRRRRRRRRGGRGRGRGRGAEGTETEGGEVLEAEVLEAEGLEEAEEGEPLPVAPRGPRPTPFGSVWDSQIGIPRAPLAPSGVTPSAEEEDFEEPEIPEYLIAERNRARSGRGAGSGGRGGPRGGRSAYAAALDRERFGGGRSGGINRYPDVSGRGGTGRAEPARRPERFERPDRGPRPERRSSEPWSEVPPDVEELVRAQLAARGGPLESEPATQEAARPASETTATPTSGRGRGRGRTAARGAIAAGEPAATAGAGGSATEAAALGPVEAAAIAEPVPAIETAAPRRRTRRSTAPEAIGAEAVEASTAASPAGGLVAAPEAEAPKRRTRRTAGGATASTASTAEPGVPAGPSETAQPAPRATRRRTTAGTTAGATASSDETAGVAGALPEVAPEPPRRRTRRTAPGGD